MNVLMLQSVLFEDEFSSDFVTMLKNAYQSQGCKVFVYNMPAYDDADHWAGYAILDNSNNADMLVCLDFPTALIKHPRKRVILTKQPPENDSFEQAIAQVRLESFDFYRVSGVDYDCPLLPPLDDYIARGIDI
jgi:hypothetical protein